MLFINTCTVLFFLFFHNNHYSFLFFDINSFNNHVNDNTNNNDAMNNTFYNEINTFFNKNVCYNHVILIIIIVLIVLQSFLWYFYISKNSKLTFKWSYFYFWLNFLLILLFFVFSFFFVKYFYLFFQKNEFHYLYDLLSLQNNSFSFKKMFQHFFDFFHPSNEIQLITGPFNFCFLKSYSLNEKISYSRDLWNMLNTNNNTSLFFPEVLFRYELDKINIIYEVKEIVSSFYKIHKTRIS